MRIEVRITSGTHDYGEYYLGKARFYECWSDADDIPATNPIYKRWISTDTSPVKCNNAADAQECARNLAEWIIKFRGYDNCEIVSY